jgi:hypothetical protein
MPNVRQLALKLPSRAAVPPRQLVHLIVTSSSLPSCCQSLINRNGGSKRAAMLMLACSLFRLCSSQHVF